jgi:hypothetical protein
LIYAYAISDEIRTAKSTAANKPCWTELAEKLNEFTEDCDVKLKAYLFSGFNAASVSQFATLSTRTRGANQDYFYSTILLFFIRQHQDGLLNSELFTRLSSKDDRGFPIIASKIIQGVLDDGVPVSTPENSREVKVRINVKDENHNKYANYQSKFTLDSGSKSELHFVIYRPAKSDPEILIKSFLAVSKPSGVYQDKDAFAFSHIYVPPTVGGGERRFSGGKVLPLDDGVFLIGGQRPYKDDKRALPFSSIKALVIRWHDLDRGHALFPSIVLTTNYRGIPILSRAVFRVTAINHSSGLDLGPVPVTGLVDDLISDFEKENEVLGSIGDNEAVSREALDRLKRISSVAEAPALARQIVKMTSNGPGKNGKWSAPTGFAKKTGKAPQRLTTDVIRSAVSDAFSTGYASEYKEGDDGPVFDLWRDVRFGPIEAE